ncbi:hypothetical protein HF650_14535 [Kosakonia sp. SMBL-WEM22]|nr:hypothetical protein HF650_14535 [Kosakonia sp. SMBL-WEM22]
MEGGFGECFDFSHPKLLKEGILADMSAECTTISLPFTEQQLRECLRQCIYRFRYHKALCKNNVRYGLDGNPCGQVTIEQKALDKAMVHRLRHNKN